MISEIHKRRMGARRHSVFKQPPTHLPISTPSRGGPLIDLSLPYNSLYLRQQKFNSLTVTALPNQSFLFPIESTSNDYCTYQVTAYNELLANTLQPCRCGRSCFHGLTLAGMHGLRWTPYCQHPAG